MSQEHMLMGFSVALICAAGFGKANWILRHTQKGQRLAAWLGPTKAIWFLRGLLLLGMLLGLALATGLVSPLEW